MRFTFLRELAHMAPLPLTYPIAFKGVSLDDRGRHSTAIASGAANVCHEVTYDPEQFELSIGGCVIKASDRQGFLQKFGANSALLDATTLDVPELMLLTNFLCTSSKHIGYLYVEPKGYKSKSEAGADLHGFALSSAYSPFAPIPGFTPELSAQRQGRLLAFLGFEPSRLSRVLSPDETAHIKTWSVAFGVPPFQANWEMHALMQNAEVLSEAGAQGDRSEDVHFVGANDPLAAFNLIESVAQAVNNQHERLILAPLGTKPASISVALYASLRPDVRLMFDFPRRLPERSFGIGRAHHYGVSLN